MSKRGMSRRELIKLGLVGSGAIIARNAMAQACVDQTPVDPHLVEFTGCGSSEAMPVSPFICDPFKDPLPVPKTMRPGYRQEDGTIVPGTGRYRRDGLYPAGAWKVREAGPGVADMNGAVAPGPAPGHQDAMGERAVMHTTPTRRLPPAGTHQLFPGGLGSSYAELAKDPKAKAAFDALADPILFHIRLQLGQHSFTSSPVVPIDAGGNVVQLPPGANPDPAGTVEWFDAAAGGYVTLPAYKLPSTTVYGFNGAFPGAMINAEYGRPVLIRFENDLDLNFSCAAGMDRQDFGAPDWAFLCHLHNGHTAPESDGNPHHLVDNEGGYIPGQWSDNLYLMYGAGGDEAEKQSFLWFHDHRMHHTGPNVYKGMVGLLPHYDPQRDNGDENNPGPIAAATGIRYPGVRTNNLGPDGQPDGTFDVDYDIPLALYDCVLDDGVTEHRDMHQTAATCGLTHPEWWGRLFLQHMVNHGFVGDIFTVNCKAYPVLRVKRRRYRLRFLGASLARQYRLSIRSLPPDEQLLPLPGVQGQWGFGEIKVGNSGKWIPCAGDIAFEMFQIACEGGLQTKGFSRTEVEIWPAKRREMIVDFANTINGPTKDGDVFYLTNTLKMTDGRMEDSPDPTYAIAMMKIVVEDDPTIVDNSTDPADIVAFNDAGGQLRPLPPVLVRNPTRTFKLQRGSGIGETQWLINGLEFNPLAPLAFLKLGAPEAWRVDNGGGGWTHPMHLHQEEHQVLWRDGDKPQPEDPLGKEDVIALEPSERTIVYRRFRTFLGNYVAHCHQLAHEDHNMMFGWTIVP